MISFGSMFNPERTSRRNIEGSIVNPEHNLERLNANQAQHVFGKIGEEPIEHMDFGKIEQAPLELFIDEDIDNPERNIENLKYGQEVEPSKSFSITPQESLGRIHVMMSNRTNSAEPNYEDKELLSKLNFKKYGFYENNNDFWVHSSTKKQNGSRSFALGDGRLQNGTNRADFVKGLINENVQGFNIVGTNNEGTKFSATLVYDKDTELVTIYSSDQNLDSACLEFFGFDDFKSAIYSTIDKLDTITGVTVWQ